MTQKFTATFLFSLAQQGRIVNNNTVPSGGSALDGQLFLIQEEGGLERWFNLTITNVGLESVADYTCVAVNAGGVMEENIALTFEEPEPVSDCRPVLALAHPHLRDSSIDESSLFPREIPSPRWAPSSPRRPSPPPATHFDRRTPRRTRRRARSPAPSAAKKAGNLSEGKKGLLPSPLFLLGEEKRPHFHPAERGELFAPRPFSQLHLFSFA